MTYNQIYFVDVRFEVGAESAHEAADSLLRELRILQESETVENYTVINVVEENLTDEDELE